MNFNFYIIGNPDEKYSQYPNDYTSSSFLEHTRYLKGSRLVIIREMNLFHYIFLEQLHGDNFIGFCLIMNRSNVYDVHNLINLFRKTIEDRLIYAGKILRYTDSGDLRYNITSFETCVTDLEELREFIESELNNNSIEYGFREVTSTYNGTRTISRVSMSLSNDEIVSETQKHNTVVLNDKNGIENFYIDKLISDFQYKNTTLKNQIVNLQGEVKNLSNQKKRLSTVLWLSFIMIVVSITAVMIVSSKNKQINSITYERQAFEAQTNKQINGLNKQIKDIANEKAEISNKYKKYQGKIEELSKALGKQNQLKAEIDSMTVVINKNNTLIFSLKEQLKDEVRKNKVAENNLSNLRNQISAEFPLIISNIEIANVYNDGTIETNYGNNIYSNDTMYFSFRMTYTALISGTKTLKVKLYRPDGTLSRGDSSPAGFSYSNTISLSRGESTSYIFSGWGNTSRGYWKSGSYRIEIWYGNVCLKSKTFTIY